MSPFSLLENNGILPVQIFLTLSLISIFQVNGFDNLVFAMGYERPGQLRFVEGDVICCRIDSSALTSIYGAEHVMMATDSTRVAHIEANGKSFTSASIREVNFVEMTRKEDYSSCRVANEQYDFIMFDKGVSFQDPLQSVRKARESISTYGRTYYDFTGCNCQHWVTSWRYGKAWSVQSHQPPNRRCALRDLLTTGTHAGATSYSKSGQVGASASATLGKAFVGSGIFSAKVTVPSVAAHAEAGKDYTGAGFKASLIEYKGAIGNNHVGMKIGLAADTEVGAGLDGATVKVLGTGLKVSRSQGVHFCLFGSCLIIG